jgi:signal transduction histidine kinase
LNDAYQSDIAAIQDIPAVPTILEVICRTTGMGFAAVARVTEGRWIACEVRDNIAFGLEPGGELKVETTICHEIRQSGEPVIIDDVPNDEVYCRHPTPAMYGFRSYISMPITLADGSFFGTLCAIDPNPNKLRTPQVIGMFKLFAELISFHLDAHARLASSEANLLGERQTSELRDQFIAVLGHDLRNPLASIDGGARMLLKTPLNDRALTIVGLMQTTVSRMSGLIDNVLDFARGRLGGGLTVTFERKPLSPVLEQVVAELRSAWPNRTIRTSFELPDRVEADHGRIAQLFSNLLGNALTHGDAEEPVLASAAIADGVLTLAVTNAGRPIGPETMSRLFQPFYRGEARANAQGLGLGLFIAAEIAKAHGGELTVSSDDDATTFALRVPVTRQQRSA